MSNEQGYRDLAASGGLFKDSQDARIRGRDLTDIEALHRIAGLLDEGVWNVHSTIAVVEIVRRTGREIRDHNDGGP